MVVSLSTNNPSTPTRPPLIPSEKSTNGTAASAAPHKRPPNSKHVTSRYLFPPSPLRKRATSANRARPLDSSSPNPTTTRSLSVSFQGHSFSLRTTRDKPAPAKPAVRPRTPRPLTRSLEGKDSVLAAVRLLRHAVVFDDGEDVCLSSDSDSLSSSGSSQEAGVPLHRPVPRGISVPARFRAESGSAKTKDHSQLASPRRREVASLLLKRRKEETGPPVRSAIGGAAEEQVGRVTSVVNFGAEVGRGKKGESRAEEAHALRLMYNRYLQWRCVNARAGAALLAQRQSVEQNLYNTATTLSEMCDSVALKGIDLQLRTQDLKLSSILNGQMMYLEQWSLMDRENQNSLSGTIEALKASTLRLPVVGGAKADIHELQNAVTSAVEVMRAMGTSTHYLLSKVEGTNALMSELGKTVAHEWALLDQSEDLLSTVAAMHVKQCSLQGQILQLNCKPDLVQL